MDLIDKKILKAVALDSRASVKQIARAVQKSKETVNYRLNRMINDKTILSFYANINCGKLGYSYYKILFKYKTMNSKTEKEMMSFLKRDKNMVWVGNCDGEYQLMISLLTRGLGELRDFLNSFLGKFGEYLYSKEILQITSFDLLGENYLDVKAGKKSGKENVACEKEVVDEKDMKILGILAGDARIKLVDVAAKVGLSAEAVSYRIKNLVKRGIVSGFRARVNYSKLDYLYYQILFSFNNVAARDKMMERFAGHSNCVAMIEFVGKYDLQLEFVVRDARELRKITEDVRRDYGEQIEGYTSLMVYGEHGVVAFPNA